MMSYSLKFRRTLSSSRMNRSYIQPSRKRRLAFRGKQSVSSSSLTLYRWRHYLKEVATTYAALKRRFLPPDRGSVLSGVPLLGPQAEWSKRDYRVWNKILVPQPAPSAALSVDIISLKWDAVRTHLMQWNRTHPLRLLDHMGVHLWATEIMCSSSCAAS